MSEVIYKFFSGKSGNYTANFQTAVRDLEEMRSSALTSMPGVYKAISNVINFCKDKQKKALAWTKAKQKKLFGELLAMISDIKEAVFAGNESLALEYAAIMTLYLNSNFSVDGVERMDPDQLHARKHNASNRAVKAELGKKMDAIEEKMLGVRAKRDEVAAEIDRIKADIAAGKIGENKKAETLMKLKHLTRDLGDLESNLKVYQGEYDTQKKLYDNARAVIALDKELGDTMQLIGTFDILNVEDYNRKLEALHSEKTKLDTKTEARQSTDDVYNTQHKNTKEEDEFEDLWAKGKKAQETNKNDDEFRYNGNMQG